MVSAVCGIWIDDQFSVRQVLLQDERVHRVDDDIGAAIDDQRWLSDCFQIIVGMIASRTPFGDGRALRRSDLVGNFGIAVYRTKPETPERNSRPAAWLAGDGVKKTLSQRLSGGS
jgi:hypothetical protein